MIRFGIIGAGRIAQVHARSISQHDHAELVVIADPVAQSREELAAKYRVEAVSEAAEVFAREDLDAVVICSPTPLHIEHIEAAVAAGKAALCEKPVAMEVPAARELAQRLEGKDARVMLGFNRRFDPNFASAHNLVQPGSCEEVGPVEQLTIISRDPAAPPKEYIAVSGGIFKDMTIHDFDMARFFLGDIVTVNATGQNLDPELADTGDFDAAVITLTAASGAVATIINSRHCATGYDQRLEAFGPGGSVFVENVCPTTVKLNRDHYSSSRDPYLNFFLERYEAAYYRELDSFIETLRGGGEFTPSINDGIEALRIAEAAELSAREGRPVALAEIN